MSLPTAKPKPTPHSESPKNKSTRNNIEMVDDDKKLRNDNAITDDEIHASDLKS